jgi:outer membrane protein assembly factor BamA
LTAARGPTQRWRLAVLAVLAMGTSATAADLDREELERFEGRPVTRLELVGHEATKDFVVERELRTEVGQPFRLATLEADLVRLENLNIFASVDVISEADTDGLALELELKEMPPVIPFVSFQYTEENGFSVGPALSASNLLGRDIQLAGRAYFGGTQTYWARLSYPWITGNHMSLDFYGAHLVRDDTLRGFEERSDELTPWLGTYLGDHGRLKGTVSLFRMRSDVDGVTLSPDNDDTLVRLGASFGWDSRDSWRSPHRGWQNELEVWRTGGFLGGNGDFWSMNLDIRRFQPGGQRGTVVAASLLSLQSGTSGEDIPRYLQYHHGGANTLRGYDHNELGEELYGKNQLITTLEYRFELLPIRRFDILKWSFSLGVELAAFTDVGIAWDQPEQLASDRFRAGGGVGIRLLVPGAEQTRFEIGFSRGGGIEFHFGGQAKLTAQRLRVR